MLNRVLLTTDAVGGVWRYSMELALGLAVRKVEVILAVLGPPPDAKQVAEAAAISGLRLTVTGLPLDWLAETASAVGATGSALAGMARRFDVDTVQVHAPALVGDASWPVPVVAVAHSCVATWWDAVREGPMPAGYEWRARATETGITHADIVVAPTSSFADALRRCYSVGRPIEVVLNGRTPACVKAERRGDALTVGRLWDEGKNVAALDAAAAALPYPVSAAGPVRGPNSSQVTCRHLRMLGPLDGPALAEAYARAAIFVSVAHYEPFGLAVLEAAQAGCALVLSDIPTFRELWGGVAVFVPPHDIRRIAATLECLMRQPEVCAQKGAAARCHAKSLSGGRMADAMWNIHAKLAVGYGTG